ncbi:MAG: hypothetical protein AAB066_01550 [Candidatus Margulisiibacteriota bacterium]
MKRKSDKTEWFWLWVVIVIVVLWQQYEHRTLHRQLVEVTATVNRLKEKASELDPYMQTLQYHMGKLWFAVRAGNWELAAFQYEELAETVETVKELHQTEHNVNVTQMIEELMDPRLDNMKTAIAERRLDAFVTRYRQTLISCNNCHDATGHPYIQITIPNLPPVPNQNWATQ